MRGAWTASLVFRQTSRRDESHHDGLSEELLLVLCRSFQTCCRVKVINWTNRTVHHGVAIASPRAREPPDPRCNSRLRDGVFPVQAIHARARGVRRVGIRGAVGREMAGATQGPVR
jgi:hypothetical protein